MQHLKKQRKNLLIIVYVQKVCRTKENLPRYKSFLTNLTIDRTTESRYTKFNSVISYTHLRQSSTSTFKTKVLRYIPINAKSDEIKKTTPPTCSKQSHVEMFKGSAVFFLQRFFFNFHHRYLGNASVVK